MLLSNRTVCTIRMIAVHREGSAGEKEVTVVRPKASRHYGLGLLLHHLGISEGRELTMMTRRWILCVLVLLVCASCASVKAPDPLTVEVRSVSEKGTVRCVMGCDLL